MFIWLIVGACGGALSLATYAMLSTFQPGATTGPVTVALLLPPVVSILVLVRGRRRGLGVGREEHGAGR